MDTEFSQIFASLSASDKRALLFKLLRQQTRQDRPAWEDLSHNQRAIWYHAQLAPESAAYNLLLAIRISPALKSNAFQRASGILARRYPMLTATYALLDSTPVQYYSYKDVLPLEEVLAEGWSDDELEKHIISLGRRPMDLEKGPLFRMVLFRRTGAEDVVACVAHHIIIDFWAFHIVIEELFRIYEAEVTRQPLTLPPPPQHGDYVR